MAEYKYVTYETLDDGADRADHAQPGEEPERAEPRAARRARRRVPARRGRRHRPGRDPRRRRPDLLVGPRPRLEGGDRRATGRPRRAPHVLDQRRHPQGRREPDAPGVALLLREHEALAEPAQDHDRPGARHRLRRRPHAHVGVRPDRRVRGRARSPTSSAPGSACAASSTSPTRGSSVRARPRSSCSPATPSTSRRPTGSAWSARSSPNDELADTHARVRPAHRARCRR